MDATTSREATELEYAERFFARGFVVAGGLFWAAAAFAGPYVYGQTSFLESAQTAMWPFLAAVVTLLVGWRYERLAALLLFNASAAVPVWGILYDWELGVWVIMIIVLLCPMVFAGILFLLSARAESIRLQADEEDEREPTAPLGSSIRKSILPG